MYQAIGFLSGAMLAAVVLASFNSNLNFLGGLFFIMAAGGAGVVLGAIADGITETTDV